MCAHGPRLAAVSTRQREAPRRRPCCYLPLSPGRGVHVRDAASVGPSHPIVPGDPCQRGRLVPSSTTALHATRHSGPRAALLLARRRLPPECGRLRPLLRDARRGRRAGARRRAIAAPPPPILLRAVARPSPLVSMVAVAQRSVRRG